MCRSNWSTSGPLHIFCRSNKKQMKCGLLGWSKHVRYTVLAVYPRFLAGIRELWNALISMCGLAIHWGGQAVTILRYTNIQEGHPALLLPFHGELDAWSCYWGIDGTWPVFFTMLPDDTLGIGIYFRWCLNYWSKIGNWRPAWTTLSMPAQRTTSLLHLLMWEDG